MIRPDTCTFNLPRLASFRQNVLLLNWSGNLQRQSTCWWTSCYSNGYYSSHRRRRSDRTRRIAPVYTPIQYTVSWDHASESILSGISIGLAVYAQFTYMPYAHRQSPRYVTTSVAIAHVRCRLKIDKWVARGIDVLGIRHNLRNCFHSEWGRGVMRDPYLGMNNLHARANVRGTKDGYWRTYSGSRHIRRQLAAEILRTPTSVDFPSSFRQLSCHLITAIFLGLYVYLPWYTRNHCARLTTCISQATDLNNLLLV